MSDPELKENPERAGCPIPNASAQQETRSGLSGTSVLSHGSELLCSERYQIQSPTSSVRSKSYVPSPELRARMDTGAGSENHDRPENAKSYPIAATPPTPSDSPGDLNLRNAQSSSKEEQLTEPVQEEDPGSSFVWVPNGDLIPIVAQREYSSGNLSGFINLLTEDESSLSTANSEDTLSSGACSNNTMVEDKAEIHRDPTTDNIGEDDGLPFHMDDINEGAPIIMEDGDQVKCKPAGLFTSSLALSFSSDSNTRPALSIRNITANHTQQKGSGKSATPTPTQRSPSTSNASETSTTSSHSSVPTYQNHTEGMQRINNTFPYLVKSFYHLILLYYAVIHPEVSEICQIECSFKRPTLCHSIARLLPQTAFDFKRKLEMYGIKGEFQFHSRGLDQDYKKCNGTLTAVFKFPQKPQRINILNYENCEFKISVNVYEGPVGDNQIIGQSSSTRSLDDDDRKRGTLHMTVHKVVSLRKIIFTDMDPPVDKIFIQVVVELRAKGQKNVHRQAKQEGQ